jgi:outer membrane protein TolC
MKPVVYCSALISVLLLQPGVLRAQAPASNGPSEQGQASLSQRGGTGAAISGANLLAAGTQNPFLAGVPTGTATSEVLRLSLGDVMTRALRYNLGGVLSQQGIRSARGARLLALSQLLPNLTTGGQFTEEQVNLAALGFSGFPGVPNVIGPFSVFDARAYLNQPVLDFVALNRAKAESQNIRAAQFSDTNARETIVFVSGNLYLQIISDDSRIDAVRAQVATSEALYRLAVDQKAAGVVAGIDVLRAQVELQAQQQRLIVAEDQFAKDKLVLARAIGLPLGQDFMLTDTMPFAPIAAMDLNATVERAYRDRPDYHAAQAQVQSAELNKKAAQAARLPSIGFHADYGDIGQRPWSSHGTFTVLANLRFPIFQGGSVQGRVLEADALLQQRQAELEDLKGRIYYEIRTAFLDLKAAEERVQVAASAQNLAQEQLVQARDRFAAGVANNIEVVQAQDTVALAMENYIASLYAHNAAKLAVAKAAGVSENGYEAFLRGK